MLSKFVMIVFLVGVFAGEPGMAEGVDAFAPETLEGGAEAEMPAYSESVVSAEWIKGSELAAQFARHDLERQFLDLMESQVQALPRHFLRFRDPYVELKIPMALIQDLRAMKSLSLLIIEGGRFVSKDAESEVNAVYIFSKQVSDDHSALKQNLRDFRSMWSQEGIRLREESRSAFQQALEQRNYDEAVNTLLISGAEFFPVFASEQVQNWISDAKLKAAQTEQIIGFGYGRNTAIGLAGAIAFGSYMSLLFLDSGGTPPGYIRASIEYSMALGFSVGWLDVLRILRAGPRAIQRRMSSNSVLVQISTIISDLEEKLMNPIETNASKVAFVAVPTNLGGFGLPVLANLQAAMDRLSISKVTRDSMDFYFFEDSKKRKELLEYLAKTRDVISAIKSRGSVAQKEMLLKSGMDTTLEGVLVESHTSEIKASASECQIFDTMPKVDRGDVVVRAAQQRAAQMLSVAPKR